MPFAPAASGIRLVRVCRSRCQTLTYVDPRRRPYLSRTWPSAIAELRCIITFPSSISSHFLLTLPKCWVTSQKHLRENDKCGNNTTVEFRVTILRQFSYYTPGRRFSSKFIGPRVSVTPSRILVTNGPADFKQENRCYSRQIRPGASCCVARAQRPGRLVLNSSSHRIKPGLRY